MQAIRPVSFPLNRRPVSNKRLHYTLGFLAIIAGILGSFLLITPTISFTFDDCLTIGTFVAIGVWSLAALYQTIYERPYSLNCSHWVFVLFFLSYAPLIQFLTQNFPAQADVGAFGPLHLETNGLILLWCAFYTLAYYCVSALKFKRPPVRMMVDARPNYAWLILFSLVCTALAFKIVGASQLFSRVGESDGAGAALGSSGGLLISTISRACPLGALIILSLSGVRKHAWYYIALVCLVACALITNFPPAVSRFLSGAILISFLCIALRRQRLSGLWLLLLFFMSFVVALPFFNLFRVNSVQDAGVSTYKQQDLASVVTGGDFDAYMMTIAAVSYGQKPSNITMGRQLLGALLFFVPRAGWSDKPIATGSMVVHDTILSFDNLSSPLPAEGFVNFGTPGVALFAIGFAWILAALDKKYWREMAGSLQTRPNLLAIVYPLLIGLVIFIMRGSLLNSYAYTMGLVGGCWISLNVAYFGTRTKNIAGNSLSVLPYTRQPAASVPPSRFDSGPRS